LAGTTNIFTVRVTDNGTPPLSDSAVVSVVVSAMPTISIADISVPGGSSGTRIAAFEVTLSAPPVYPVWVDFATTNGTATYDADYTATNGTLHFPVNTTNQTIQVFVIGRPDYHVVRDFFINLTNATNAVLGDSQALGTILDEPASGVVVEDVIVAEGTRTKTVATFTVNLTEASDRLVTLRYAISNGTATVAKDFRRRKGIVSFPPGVTSQSIQVPIIGDSLNEDDEFFTIHFETPMNAALKTAHATGTIIDDDPLPTLDFTRSDFSGSREIPFLVRLSERSGRTVSVNFATEDGTAFAGTDYSSTNGTLIFLPGTRSQRVTVPVNRPNGRTERTFFLNLDTPLNATLAEPQATGHIKK
jgi:hypothetical protein